MEKIDPDFVVVSCPEVEPLGDAVYVYITLPGEPSGIAQIEMNGRMFRLYVNSTDGE
jgi:hypothetical protein